MSAVPAAANRAPAANSPTQGEVVAAITQIAGLPFEAPALRYLTSQRSQLLSAITLRDPDSIAQVVVQSLKRLFQGANINVHLTARDLREYLGARGWGEIHDALAGNTGAAFAIEQHLLTLQNKGTPSAATPAPAPPETPPAVGSQSRGPAAQAAQVHWRERPAQARVIDRQGVRTGFTPQQAPEDEDDAGGHAVHDDDDGDAVRIVTPVGEAIYPYLDKPDEFKGKNEYKTELAVTPEALAPLRAQLEALRDAHAEKIRAELRANSRKAHLADSLLIKPIGKPEYADGRPTGRLLLRAKSKAVGVKADKSTFDRKPRVYDKDAKPLETMPAVYTGSKIALSCIARPYHKPDNNEIGVTLYIEAVQIVKLVTGRSSAPPNDGFVRVDG